MEPNSSNPPQLPTAVSTVLNHQHFSFSSAAQISQSSTSNYHYNYNYCYHFNCNQNQAAQYCFGLTNRRACSRQMVVGQDHPSSISKMARVCRRMARQRRLLWLNGARINQNSAEARRTVVSNSHVQVEEQQVNNYEFRRNVFNFITPDNKRLRVLVKKALKNSDVGALGRIVLPKRAAEENLPSLVEKEGMQLVVREVMSSDQSSWTFKYKFWSNNNSRMYVLENTGEFVRQKKLGVGDSFTLYEDESKNLYVSVTKGAESVAGMEGEDGKAYPFGEEEASLALLMDQVLACSHVDGSAPLTYPIPIDVDGAQPIRCTEEEGSCSWRMAAVDSVVVGGQDRAFDDSYGFLDTLPDVNHYNFSP